MLIKFDHFTDPPDPGSGFISRSDDVPDPVLVPVDDKAWLQALLFPDGSALIDYGDGTLLIDEKPPYGKGQGGDDIASAEFCVPTRQPLTATTSRLCRPGQGRDDIASVYLGRDDRPGHPCIEVGAAPRAALASLPLVGRALRARLGRDASATRPPESLLRSHIATSKTLALVATSSTYLVQDSSLSKFQGLWRIDAGAKPLRIPDMKCLFLDEAGNFDFTEKGTPYLMVCATLLDISAARSGELSCLRYELNAQGHDIESFHASANTPYVRGAFMRRITAAGATYQVFAIVMDKALCRRPPHDLSQVYVDLFKFVLAMSHPASGDCPVYADRVPLQRSRKAIMKAVRSSAGHRSVHFHSSASSLELQIADYCTWAVWRQLVSQDFKPLEALGMPTVHLAVIGKG